MHFNFLYLFFPAPITILDDPTAVFVLCFKLVDNFQAHFFSIGLSLIQPRLKFLKYNIKITPSATIFFSFCSLILFCKASISYLTLVINFWVYSRSPSISWILPRSSILTISSAKPSNKCIFACYFFFFYYSSSLSLFSSAFSS